MEIQQFNQETKGSFKAFKEGVEAGAMTYTWAGKDKLIIDHTDVNPDFAHQGVGQQLVMAAVTFARENNIRILPLCPFAKSVFDKTKEIQDLLF